ncbi:Electron transport complex subunit RsxG [Stieleria neptunia]|uniref:Electron transport complex subunit RsxG n=1 Tax=Stieleria neptunia TaxID=2527979 RepID=A0A518I2R1_9BACT|nr:FMN-binding protein [Stieleria neptunia]QDV47395.1 Electron transport complex subunit RsxG [Stieleria neptunia]
MERPRHIRAIVVHTVRVSTVAALLLLIPSPRRDQSTAEGGASPPAVEWIRPFLPTASVVEPGKDANGFWTVKDGDGFSLARVARTLPEAANVIGYRGPTEAMVLLDRDYRLIGVDLIESADTEEHVTAVQNDDAFFEQFHSWTWTGPEPGTSVDAVSGATLTSLALAKGVLRRIGDDLPSLVFPDAVTQEELQRWFPEASATRVEGDRVIALDRSGNELGTVIRTGPLSDSIIGYQGPTELLIRVDSAADAEDNEQPPLTVADIKIRSSFDNEPYVGYCKTEYGFWALFTGRTLTGLADMDLDAERVEGVSGATMTSMAIAETLVASAGRFQVREQQREKANQASRSSWGHWRNRVLEMLEMRLTAAEVGCVLVLCLIPLFRMRGWFRHQRIRKLWLVAVIAVIGIWSGNLISMALVAGWSGGGIAWQLAPALAAITIVAFVAPVGWKSNPYCNHLCPHGALQQLLRPHHQSKRYWKPPARLVAVLKVLPGALLVLAYLTLLWRPAIDLSSWEPFHAYLYRMAPWTAVALAGLTLLFSAFVPMGYCRLGCPTGRLLDHLRRSAGSDRLQLADGVAIGLLVVALFAA